MRLRGSTLPWRKLGLNPMDVSHLSSLKSGITAVLNAQKNSTIELAAWETTNTEHTNSAHFHVKGQKCCKRLALLNHDFLIVLKRRKEAYQLGQITKERKRMAQAAGAQAKRSRHKTRP